MKAQRALGQTVRDHLILFVFICLGAGPDSTGSFASSFKTAAEGGEVARNQLREPELDLDTASALQTLDVASNRIVSLKVETLTSAPWRYTRSIYLVAFLRYISRRTSYKFIRNNGLSKNQIAGNRHSARSRYFQHSFPSALRNQICIHSVSVFFSGYMCIGLAPLLQKMGTCNSCQTRFYMFCRGNLKRPTLLGRRKNIRTMAKATSFFPCCWRECCPARSVVLRA